jgi:uncharacterized GH25 family protein
MKKIFVVMLIGLILASQIIAHDLYLKTENYFAAPNGTVKFEVLNGELNQSVAPFTVARFSDASLLFPVGKITRFKVEDLIKGEKSSFINLPTEGNGTYIFGISTTARELVFTAKQFNEALKSEKIPDALAERERLGEMEKDAKGIYSRHAKAIFQVGDKTDNGYKNILGYPVEIVPQKNPYSLKNGKTLEVLCLLNGKPVVNQTVFAGYETAEGKLVVEPNVRTNKKGIAKIKLNGAGKWFVRFAGFVRVSGKSYDHESAWATLSFAVR